MRKIGLFSLLFVFVLLLGACSSGEKSNLTLDDFKKAFQDNGLVEGEIKEVVAENVGAVDGFIFYNERMPIKVYEYKSEKALDKALDEVDSLKASYPKNGKFLLASEHEKAIKIFTELKK